MHMQIMAMAAEKFPILVTSLVEPLRDFLVTPSHVMNKLNKYASGGSKIIKVQGVSITVTDETQK